MLSISSLEETDVRELRVDEDSPGRYIELSVVGLILLDILAILWGQPGEALSTGILDQPLGPPGTEDS